MRGVPARSLKHAMSTSNVSTLNDAILTAGAPFVDSITVFSLQEYATRGLVGDYEQLCVWLSNTELSTNKLLTSMTASSRHTHDP